MFRAGLKTEAMIADKPSDHKGSSAPSMCGGMGGIMRNISKLFQA